MEEEGARNTKLYKKSVSTYEYNQKVLPRSGVSGFLLVVRNYLMRDNGKK